MLIVEYLRKHGILSKVNEGMRFARQCFGRNVMIDLLAILFGYAVIFGVARLYGWVGEL